MIPEHIILQANAVLHNCRGANGLRASARPTTNYQAYFTRDTVINSVGLSLTGHAHCLADLVSQVKQLKFLQGEQGQIPSNFNVAAIKGIEVSFGRLTPKLDGPSWFVIGVCHLVEKGLLDKNEWRKAVMSALSVMDALEYNGQGLIYSPAGSDWADEYICHGHVLHIQLLRAWALGAASQTFEDERLKAKEGQIVELIAERFIGDSTSDDSPPYLISSYAFDGRVEQLDLVSNVLFAHKYPTHPLSIGLLDHLSGRFLSKGLLPPAFSPEISEGDERWSRLRAFHLFEFKNMPGHYHNGGAWWIWLGWYAVVLKSHDRMNDLEKLEHLVTGVFEKNQVFEFKEYLTPEASEGGQSQMAFTASGIIMLHRIFQSHE